MASIRRQFNLAFILLVFLPGLLVSVVLSRLYISALISTVSRQTEAVIGQVAQSIRAETDGVSILASALYHDNELRALTDRYAQAAGSGERLLVGNRLEDKLVSFFVYSNRIGAVFLYMRNGVVYSYWNYTNIRSGGIDHSIYAEAKRDPGKVFLLDSLTGMAGSVGEQFILTVAVSPPASEYDTSLDAILVMFRVPYFDGLLSRSGPQAGSEVVIYGRNGRVLLSSLPASAAPERLALLVPPREAAQGREETSSFRNVAFGGRSWLASSLRMESTGWTIVLLADRAAIMGRLTSYQWYLYPALGVLTILFFVYAGMFSARIANPITAVVRSMRQAGSGDYAVRVPAADGIEEMTVLTEGFNRMMVELRTLTQEREERERQRMKAELEALRFQISPHFVSNTLNSIRLMARAAKAEAIADMTQRLMRVLADSYAVAGPFTDLAHELANVESYVGIMKVRFGANFDVDYRVEEEARDCMVLRMIIQPIVENSILHGISGCGRRGAISLEARLEEARGQTPPSLPEQGLIACPGKVLLLEVRDNGVGMDGERVASVLSGPAQPQGDGGSLHRIGLANVRQRIRLNFGEPFDLALASEPGRFTRVTLRLPMILRAGARDA
jgi:two-component system sensor histidine kinase YesM